MITSADVAAYALALGVAAAIPGPGMTALVARSIGSGPLAGFAMLAGLAIGDIIYLSFAVFGLAIIAKSFASLFVVIRWASIAYLLYIAWQFWTAERQSLDSAPVTRQRELFGATLSGLAITLGNPKTIAFYLALLPLVLDLGEVTVAAWGTVLIPVTIAVLAVVGGVFIVGALAIRRMLSSALAQKRLYRGAAVAMAGAAGSMILRDL